MPCFVFLKHQYAKIAIYAYMNKEIHFKGVWFLPENQENKVTGDLHYTPENGITLSLLGGLSEITSDFFDPELILGITADGKKISLYKCFRRQRVFNFPGLVTSEFGADFVLIGRHFSSTSEMKFKEIVGSIEDFDYWLDRFGFTVVDYDKESKKCIIEYTNPEDLLFAISEKIACVFQCSFNFPLTKEGSTKIIEQEYLIVLKPKEGIESFETLLDWFLLFHKFLILAYFGKPVVRRLEVRISPPEDSGELLDEEITILYQTDILEAPYKPRRRQIQFLFTYKEIRSNLNLILQKWFHLADILSPTISALVESYIDRGVFVEFKFLSLAHAIETYHRRTMPNYEEPKEDHQNKIKNIVDSVDGQYRNWLKSKLEFSNEKTLQQRLKELCRLIPDPIAKIILKPTPEKFIACIKDSRNYYTHYGKHLEGKALKSIELSSLTERMKIFLTCLVLRELGFTETEIATIIIKKGVYLYNHVISYDEAKTFLNNTKQ